MKQLQKIKGIAVCNSCKLVCELDKIIDREVCGSPCRDFNKGGFKKCRGKTYTLFEPAKK